MTTRRRIVEAIQARDVDTLLDAVHPDAIVLNHSVRGKAQARQVFSKGAASDEQYWEPLRRMLELGGTFTTRLGSGLTPVEFCAPYAYAKYPSDSEIPPQLNGFENDPIVILENRVPLRARPEARARVLEFLSHDLVAWDSAGDVHETGTGRLLWRRVSDGRGHDGFVSPDETWNPESDFRACFGQFDGRWLMTMFQNDAAMSPRFVK